MEVLELVEPVWEALLRALRAVGIPSLLAIGAVVGIYHWLNRR